MAVELPYDVVAEILSRLPVKSLSRFKCVSKSCLSLISSRQFIKAHLKNSKTAPNYTHLSFLINWNLKLQRACFNSILYGPTTDDIFDVDCLTFDRNSAKSFRKQFGKAVRIVGSCDGLICLCEDNRDLILLNPSTRKWKKLPHFGVKTTAGIDFAIGFGFDESTDDYKVVGFFYRNFNYTSEFIVKVYSLKTDQWKIMIPNYKGWLEMDPATFAKGKLHWVVSSDRESKTKCDILTLDLKTEEYRIIQTPDYVEDSYYARLGANEESLYVFLNYREHGDVWILDGYGVRSQVTWIKIASIPLNDGILEANFIRLLYVLKNGDVLFLNALTILIYDEKNCSFRYHHEFKSYNALIQFITYVETLVSLSF